MTSAYASRPATDLVTPRDAARAIAANPPDIPGWELVGDGELVGAHDVRLSYEDDDGAVAWLTVRVVSVETDESAVPPEPRGREKGDDDT